MIKPTALWNAMKSCRNSKALGDAMRALGKQDVELDEYAQFIYDTIVNDNEWMEEQITEKREQERLRKQLYRQKKTDAPQADPKAPNAPTAPIDSTDPKAPTDPTDPKGSKDPTDPKDSKDPTAPAPTADPARPLRAPTWEEVLLALKTNASLSVNPIPVAFAREWFDAAVMSEWRDTRGMDMRQSFVWKRKLQYEWIEALKAQRRENGGKTDHEIRRAAEREQERQAVAARTEMIDDSDD